jgi:hypothetical protein
MNTILKTLRALPLAMVMALCIVSLPTLSHADDAAPAAASTTVDNQFVDGNWFAIAEAKGEAYGEGSQTNVALNAQLELYQTAVDDKNTADAEHYAIRSWVKANYAMLLGQNALEAGKYAEAKTHLNRALKLAKAAQKDGAGKGQKGDRVDDDNAAAWQGTSKIEGARAEARVKAFLAKLRAKTGDAE